MTADLTERQQLALDAVRAHYEAHGVPPTVTQLSAALGNNSRAGTAWLLRKLVEKGCLRPPEGRSSRDHVPTDAGPAPPIPVRTDLPPLTDRQREVLDFMAARQRERGMPPVRREIAERFGFASPNSVTCILYYLAKKGYVAKGEHHAHRTHRVVALPAG
jgi:SOS-response transcriptional repressor LexA